MQTTKRHVNECKEANFILNTWSKWLLAVDLLGIWRCYVAPQELSISACDVAFSDNKFLYCLQFNLSSAQIERNKTKEQLEEEKKISLSFRIKPLDIENLSVDKLKQKATELWDAIVKLETEKYDLEERQKRQDYDVRINFLA